MGYDMEPMLELFIFETHQMLDNIEKEVIEVEEVGNYTKASINEIFRGMHTIKGSSGMMMFDSMATLSHALEDVFDLLRNDVRIGYDTQQVTDLTLETIDFLKDELESIESKNAAQGNPEALIRKIKHYLSLLKGEPIKRGRTKREEAPFVSNYYIASQTTNEDTNVLSMTIRFSKECVMENVRAYTLMNALYNLSTEITSIPDHLLDDDLEIVDCIRQYGFYMKITANEGIETFKEFMEGYPYVESFEVKMYEASDLEGLPKFNQVNREETLILNEAIEVKEEVTADAESHEDVEIKESFVQEDDVISETKKSGHMAMISVNVEKLDRLMDLVGELVVSEAMVTRNKVIDRVLDDALEKNIRQHRKIITDVQDVAMSIRMVPLTATFQKMKRIVRDIGKTTDKNIELKLIGEETEVDKNIIEKISDPLMHLIRNSCDHGIEMPQDRIEKGKAEKGMITLEAKNSGGDVWLIVSDDGKGLDADKIYQKALEKGLVNSSAPRPNDEILYNYIFMAGFSTKDEVSQFSGRGVGMDVVVENISKIGGSITVLSEMGVGSSMIIKIPLTLSIIDGMLLTVGGRGFILPMTSIQQSFKIDEENFFMDPEGNEMLWVRGQALSVLKLYEHYRINGAIEAIKEGIMIIIGDETKKICLFADALIGERQVVMKPLPKQFKKIDGISGCAILGDGCISLILDMDGLMRIVS